MVVSIARIFSQAVGCVFTVLIILYHEQKFLILMKNNLTVFSLWCPVLLSCLTCWNSTVSLEIWKYRVLLLILSQYDLSYNRFFAFPCTFIVSSSIFTKNNFLGFWLELHRNNINLETENINSIEFQSMSKIDTAFYLGFL